MNFTGENPLGVSRAEFAMTQEGMELVYQRRYSEALEVFEECGIDFPDSPVGPVGRSLVWQAMMFENYDFSRERPYLTEYAEAKERLKRARRGRTSKSWLDFLEAVHLGLDAMYDIRKGRHIVPSTRPGTRSSSSRRWSGAHPSSTTSTSRWACTTTGAPPSPNRSTSSRPSETIGPRASLR
jgi:hypothetical protein